MRITLTTPLETIDLKLRKIRIELAKIAEDLVGINRILDHTLGKVNGGQNESEM